MYKAIIISDNGAVRDECTKIANEANEFELTYINTPDELDRIENDYNYLFILINDLVNISINKLQRINENFPTISIILYNHSLFIGKLKHLIDLPDIHIIIGEHRQEYLKEIILNLIISHWRRIPLELFDIDPTKLSQRILKAIDFIETHKLDASTLVNISEYIGLSPGYFGQEFKKETGYSFRKFIQRVLVYYEESILINMNISVIKMAKLLGYSELSSFSRSFKKRRGVSPRQFIRKSAVV